MNRLRLQDLTIFWERHPALFFGLVWLSCILSVNFSLYYLFCLLLFLFLSDSKQTLIVIILVGFAIPLSQLRTLPPGDAIEGTGCFKISSSHTTRRGGTLYQGMLSHFVPMGEKKALPQTIPCSLYSKHPYTMDYTYTVSGKLTLWKAPFYSLHTKLEWVPLERAPYLPKLRMMLKDKIRGQLKKHIQDNETYEFLAGIATGDLHDRVLAKNLATCGISHLLAISGFHFALLAWMLKFLIRPFLPYKIMNSLLIVLLSLYFLLIGPSHSVQRAYLFIFLFFAGHIIEKRPNPLNSLGVALFFGLIVDPHAILSISFQLSFLATAALLLVYTPIKQLLQYLFPSRELSEVILLPLRRQYLYMGVTILRDACALTVAVHLLVGPLLLYHFHVLPLSGLLYNLFFPILAAFSMGILFVGILLYPLVGGAIHFLNAYYTSAILKLTHIPLFSLPHFYVESFPSLIVQIYLIVLLCVLIILEALRESVSHIAG